MSEHFGNRVVYTPTQPPATARAYPPASPPTLSPSSRRRRRVVVPVVLDLAATVAAALITPTLAEAVHAPSASRPWTLALAVTTLSLLILAGTYGHRLSRKIARGMRVHIAAATAGAVIIAIVQDRVVAGQDSLAFAVPVMLQIAALGAARSGLNAAIRRGSNIVPGWRTLIAGAGGIGQVVARRVVSNANLRLYPVGVLDQDPGMTWVAGLPVLGPIGDLERVAEEVEAEHVIVAFPNAPFAEQLELVRRCEKLGLGVSIVPRLYTHVTTNSTVEHLGGVPLLTTEPARPRSLAFGIKHVVDRIVACLLLALLLPVFIGAAIAVVASMGRPVLFRQLRVGRDGRMFTMLKFRTMRTGPPDVADAERVTRTGRFLRASSIDELPQLLNVLAGHMSLIGPRPEQPALVEAFGRTVERYGERHRVKSGITGWAQVHGLGRGGSRYDVDALTERVEWDNYYAENWSPLLDLRIALLTIVALVRHRQ